jgi:integrase
MRVMSSEEARRLLEVARVTAHHALFYLALATGARLGELLAVRWQAIDLDTGVMQVTRTARFFRGQGAAFGQPKTHRSRRPIALSPETVVVLRDHKRRLLEERLRLGGAYEDQGLVFANAWGRPLTGSTVRRAFYAIARDAGIVEGL